MTKAPRPARRSAGGLKARALQCSVVVLGLLLSGAGGEHQRKTAAERHPPAAAAGNPATPTAAAPESTATKSMKDFAGSSQGAARRQKFAKSFGSDKGEATKDI